ncbi:MAG: FG-GAP-like repeat-containing protein [Pseudomonadota bacterium]
MNVLMRTMSAALVMVACVATQAHAAAKTYAALPFTINGPAGYTYLERAIPQMLNSRLYLKGEFEPISADALSGIKAPSSEAEAANVQAALGVDFVIWGSATVVGDSCSLDTTVRGADGKIWPQSSESKVNDLIPSLQKTSDSISASAFGRAIAAPAAVAAVQPVNQMNSNIVVNQTDANQQVYLNPQFRYQGEAVNDTRLRTNVLPYAARGMLIQDFNGDGENEIILLEEDFVAAYRWNGGQLVPAGQFKQSPSLENININNIDIDNDGRDELVITAVNDDDNKPRSYVLKYDGEKFEAIMTYIDYFLNVVRLAPEYTPRLIGQKTDSPRLFKPGVYELVKNGDKFMQTRRLDLPKGANVFNFAYLPDNGPEGDKIIVLTEAETLRTYTLAGARLAESETTYSGTAQGIAADANMPGMGKDTVLIPQEYYIPMHMPVVNLDGDDRWEILVNRPLSTSAQFFERYRFFPEGEIHSLYWDGLGLGLQWKTRRIKGSVVDIAVTDVDKNGVLDLVVCVNTHPGAVGLDKRKTTIIAYPLDLTQTDPKTTPHGDGLE